MSNDDEDTPIEVPIPLEKMSTELTVGRPIGSFDLRQRAERILKEISLPQLPVMKRHNRTVTMLPIEMPSASAIDFDVFLHAPGEILDVLFLQEESMISPAPGERPPVKLRPALVVGMDPAASIQRRAFVFCREGSTLNSDYALRPVGAYVLPQARKQVLLGLYEKMDIPHELRVPPAEVLARFHHMRAQQRAEEPEAVPFDKMSDLKQKKFTALGEQERADRLTAAQLLSPGEWA